MIAARWRSAILRSAFALRTAIVAAVFLSADVFTPTPIFAAEDEASVGGESLILAPSPSLAELGDESFHSLISPTANASIADTNLLLRHRDSWRRRLGLRTQSAMESLVGMPALADAMRRLESGDLLLKDFSHRAGNVFFNAAADFSANEIQRLAGLDSIVKRIEIGYDSPLGQHDGSGRADIFLSLWEDHNTLLFGQIGGILQERDNRWEPGGNVGLGLRFQAGPIIFGGNAFFDYLNDDNPGDFQRYSVGLEALTSHADWSINTYRRISDVATKTTNAGTFIVYTAEGWDSEIALRIPGAEWLELAARRYEWERERSGKLVGFDYRLSFLLLESFSLDATFDAPEDGDSDWGVNARFHFDLTDGFRFRRASAESLTDPWHRRYESVRRRYEQRIIEEITILPTPAMCDAESDTIICDFPLPSADATFRMRASVGTTSALSANQSGTTPALSANQSGSALSAIHFDPNARNCDDSGVCEWGIITVASAGESTAGVLACVINRNNNGCRIALTLSPPPELLTQGSIRVEITEAGGFTPPSAPLILDMANFFEVEFSSASAAAFAEGSAVTVSVSANIARNEDTIITVSLVAGTAATPNTDYQLLNLSSVALTCDGNNCAITLTANATVASFQITATVDTISELAESFSLMLIEGISVYALGAQTTFTSTIASDIGGGEAAVQFSAAALTENLDEGDAANIVVQANAIRNTPTTVTILLVAGTTATLDNPATPAFDGDYRLLNSSGVTLSCDGNNNCAITISANAQNEVIQITARLEGDLENVESFSLMLIDGSDYELDTSQTTFTGMINNRDGIPFIEFTAISLAAIAEGNTAEVTVQADGPVPNAIIVTISLVADTTATPITDYQLLNSGGTVISCNSLNNCAITISAGAMMEEIRISATADTTAELTEAFSLMLIDGSDYNLDSQVAFAGEIASDLGVGVNQASMEFEAARLASNLDEGGTALDITVQANAVRSTSTIVTISLVAAVDTATDATPITDYQLLNSSGNPLTCVGINNCAITIAASVTVEVIRITAIEDGIFENVESFTLSLVLGTDYAVGSQDTFGGNINNRDGTPIVQFTAASVGALAEGDTANVIVQTTTPAAPVPDATIVTISLVADTTATPGTDYQLLDSQSPPAIIACGSNNLCAITISAGAMMEQIQVTVTDESIDPIPELTEAFSLMLIDEGDITYDLGTQASFGGEITGDIAGTEASVQFSAAALTPNLDEGGTAVPITVQTNAVRNTPTIVTISLVATVDATDATPMTDYRLFDSDGTTPLTCVGINNCAITIAASVTVEVIRITAPLDGIFENVEAFSLMLINGDGYTLGSQTTFTGMINNRDGVPIIQFTANSLGSPLDEDSTAEVIVQADGPVPNATIVTISLVADTTATPITDYQLLMSTGTTPLDCDAANNCAITISAGAMMESFRISARADSTAELTEAFSLTLVDTPDYNVVGRDVFSGTIRNDGGIAAMRFSTANLAAIAEGSSAVVAVQASAPVSTPTTVTIALVAGTAATPMTDYQLRDSSGTAPLTCVNNNCAITLAANTTVASFRISATDDTISELAEAFSLMLVPSSDYALGTPNSLTGEIASDVGSVASMEFTAAGLAATLEEGSTAVPGAAVPITVQANAVRSTPTIVTISLVADPTGARRNLPDRDYQLLNSESSPTALTCDSNNRCAITISANMTVEVIQITAIANTTVELAEAFSLMLIGGSDYNLGSQRTTFTGEIASDLPGGVNQASMQFIATGLAANLDEGAIPATITVRANAVRTTPTIVTISLVATVDATDATPMADYRLFDSDGTTPLTCVGINNCAITIAANVTVEVIRITAIVDDAFENVESFTLSLVNGSDYALVSSQDTFGGMISSIDGTPIIQFVGISLSDPLRESIAEPITVQAIAPVAADTVVTVSLGGVTGDTATPIADYVLLNSGGTVISCVSNNCAITISAGMTDEIIQVMAIADTDTEASDEPFSLSLVDDGGPDGGNYDLVSSPETFTGTITDAGGVHFSTASVNSFASIFSDEGSSIDFTVETDTAFAAPTVVTILLGVTADTATPIADYVLRDSSGVTITCDAAFNCPITIPMDVTMASFQFFAIDESDLPHPELSESFSLMLVGDGSVYELVSPDTLEGVIESDIGDAQASMEFSAADLTPILDERTALDITVQANAARTTPTTVTIVIAAGNAAIFGPDTNSDADYQLLNSASSPTALTCVNNNCAITISAGVTVEVIQITAHANTTVELAEAFSLMLIDGDDYALGTQTTFTDEIASDLGVGVNEASMQFSTATLADNLDEGTTASTTNLDVVANAVRTTPTIVTISVGVTVGVNADTATPDDPATPDDSDGDFDGDYRLLDSSGNALTCDGNNNCAITIAANAMMERIQITAIAEGTFEIAESFSLVLRDGSDYALVSTQDIFTGTIDNIDGTPIVEFAADAPSAALAEGGTANVIVQTTTPAAPVFADTVVTISLVAGTTATPITDYQLLVSSGLATIACVNNNCAITISAGAMMEQIQVTVTDESIDPIPELTEAFSLVLIEHIGVYALGTQNSFGGDITGDIDGTEASVQFTAATGNLNEGGNAFIFVEANAARNTPTILTISVGVTVGVNADTATPDNPATADFDGDYRLVDTGFNALPCDDDNNCTIILAANSLDTRFLITARLDDAFENAEDFSLALIDDGDTYDLDAQDTLSGTINSIDGTPIIRLVAASLTGVTEGNAISITVQAIAPITLDIIVTISLGVDADSATDDATPMTDYRLFDSDGVTPLTCDTDNLCAITISADETDEVIQIMAITDSDTEEDESFLLTLIDEGDTTYDLVTDNALLVFAGTINAIARVQFSTANIVTIAEGFTSTNLAVSTSAPVESPITITIALVPPVNDAFATPDDPARAGFDGDYALLNSVGVALTCTGNNCLITIAMGEMMAPFQITAIDDASGAGTELAEPFRLTLIDGVTYNLATPDSLTGEIASNVPDGEARMQFSPAALVSNLDEGTTFANIVVRADFPRSTPTIVTISVGVTGNTATPDDPATADFDGDYRLLDSDGTPLACDSNNRCAITLDAAARTETFQIIARLDGDFENVQSFSLVLIRGDDYQLGAATTFTGNIDNEDGTPIIQFAAASLTDDLTEGSAAVVIVQATAPVVSETIVIISLVAAADATTDARPDDPDTSSVDGDYQLLDSAGTPITCDSNNLCRITFDAGDSEVRIQVRAVSDTQIAEEAERFSLRLIDDGAYNLGSPSTFTGTIANVAIPIVQFSTANLGAAIAEGTSVDFEVTSIAAVGTETLITIELSTDTATPDDPATADFDGDYRLLDSSDAVIPCDSNNRCVITLDANVRTEDLKITVRAGDAGEFAESFSLVLLDGDDYNLVSPATSTASGTIADNARLVITTNGATGAGARFEITVTFEPPLPESLVGGAESVNLQIRGYANFVVIDTNSFSDDFTSIAPTNFIFDRLIDSDNVDLGRRSTTTFRTAEVRNPMVAAITLKDSISGQTIEIRVSGAGTPIQNLYNQLRNTDGSRITLSVTFP